MIAFTVMLDSVTADDVDVGRPQVNGILDWRGMVSVACTRAVKCDQKAPGLEVDSGPGSETHLGWKDACGRIIAALRVQMNRADQIYNEEIVRARAADSEAATAEAEAIAWANAAQAAATASAVAAADGKDADAAAAAAYAASAMANAASWEAAGSAAAARAAAARAAAALALKWLKAAKDAADTGHALVAATTRAYAPVAAAVIGAGGSREVPAQKRYLVTESGGAR